jgi:hypothetical protein
MRFVRRHLSFANVVALLALFVALGGVSYAALKLPKNSVGTKQLKKSSVTSQKVADGTLGAQDFKPGTLLSGPQGQQGPPGPPGGSTGPPGGVLPAAAIANSIGQSIANNSIVPVSFNIEEFDSANLHSAGSPTRLTAPIAGIYQVNATVTFSLNATGVRSLSLYVNGTNVNPVGAMQVPAVTAASFPTLTAGGLVKLAAGDFVTASVSQNSGSTLEVLGTGSFSGPRFSMYWVGPAS